MHAFRGWRKAALTPARCAALCGRALPWRMPLRRWRGRMRRSLRRLASSPEARERAHGAPAKPSAATITRKNSHGRCCRQWVRRVPAIVISSRQAADPRRQNGEWRLTSFFHNFIVGISLQEEGKNDFVAKNIVFCFEDHLLYGGRRRTPLFRRTERHGKE